MRDDERLFSFGMQFIALTLIIVAIFHAAFNADEKNLIKQNRIITSLEQDLANAKVKFATLVQPNILRPIVQQIHPTYVHIGTGRSISVQNME